MIGPVILFLIGTVLVARVPVLLPVEACLMLVPLLGYGLRTRVSWLCAFLLGAAWCFCALKVERQYRQAVLESAVETTIVGQVMDMPMEGEHSVRFLVRVVDGHLAGSRLRLYWYRSDDSVKPGQKWRFNVRLRAPTGSVNFDTFDYERWLFVKRIHGLGYIDPGGDHQLLDQHASVDDLRYRIRLKIAQVVGHDTLATFLALSLGDTSQLSPDQWTVLNRTGTTHLLIVSGLHVGLIATLVFFALRFVGAGYAATSIVTVAVAATYALLAGWGLPVQRALVMTVVYLGCGLVSRNITLLSRLALAAVFVVLLDPLASLSSGFWLSFGVVAALILGLSHRVFAESSLAWARSMWFAQWVAFLSLLPLLGALNHQLPLASFPVNLIAIPVVGFILVPLILITLGLILLFESWAVSLVGLAQWVTTWLWRVLENAAASDWLLHIPAPAPWQVSIALIGAVVLLMPAGLIFRWLGLPLLLLLLKPPEMPQPGSVSVTFLDVGQGLSVLIETSNGVTLYDTGPSFPGSFSAANQIVIPVIRGRGWRSLDQLVISHSDNDHAGGRDAIVSELDVGQLLQQGSCHATWERDGAWFASFNIGLPATRNDGSCLLLIVAGGRRVLLTGDIEADGERMLLQRFSQLIDVMSVPHHGSDSSSTPALLNRLVPELAVVSAGYGNRFGHPDAEVVDRYRRRSIRLLSTADSGAVEIRLEPQGMIVIEARREPGGLWRRQ